MTKILLSFQEKENLELTKIEFSHPLLSDARLAVRGRTEGAYRDCVAFPWGKVSKAFALFLLKSKVHGAEKGVLAGVAQSPAAALDYAISKPPVWMQELFGYDGRENFLLRRMVHRSNPERKRPGPVSLGLNLRHLSVNDISICLGSRTISNALELSQILERLELELAPVNKNPALHLPVLVGQEPELKKESLLPAQWEANIYQSELYRCLKNASVFNPRKLSRYLNELHGNPSLKALLHKTEDLILPLLQEGSSNARFGAADQLFLDRELKAQSPIRVWVSAVQPAGYSLFLYLRDYAGYNIEIKSQFPYGMDLYRQLNSSNHGELPDLCALGIGPAALLFKDKTSDYQPWLLGPELSHTLVSKKGVSLADLSQGEYHFVSDEPTTASFCFDALERKGFLQKNKISRMNCEPDEVMSLFNREDENFRSLLWFPHYCYHEALNGAQIFMPTDNSVTYQPTIIFGREEFMRNAARKDALKTALFDAWLRLIEEPELLENISLQITSDREYMRYVRRCVGLQNFSSTTRCAEKSLVI